MQTCAYRLFLMLWLHTVEKLTEILTCVTFSYGFICLHNFSNRKHDFFSSALLVLWRKDALTLPENFPVEIVLISLLNIPSQPPLLPSLNGLQVLHCKENHIYVFLFWELRGLSPDFHIPVSVSNLYIPRIGLHMSLQQNIGRPIL